MNGNKKLPTALLATALGLIAMTDEGLPRCPEARGMKQRSKKFNDRRARRSKDARNHWSNEE